MSTIQTLNRPAAPRKRPAGPILAGLLAASLLAAPGCGGGGAAGREAVSGTVTMNGAPLNDALIEFVPMGTAGASFAGATIIDGAYTIQAKRGLQPGEYKVLITMAGSAPDAPVEEFPGDSLAVPVAPELIPARYNSESTLTAKVEANKQNVFDFELKR